jgi:hypothetical protein
MSLTEPLPNVPWNSICELLFRTSTVPPEKLKHPAPQPTRLSVVMVTVPSDEFSWSLTENGCPSVGAPDKFAVDPT